MPRSLRTLKLALIGAGLVLALWPLPAPWSIGFFALCIVATGIPHGAIDHVLYRHAHRGPAIWTSVRFYAEYFAWIGAYALLWWAWPEAAVLGFLLVSAYHFGQTQLAYAEAGLPVWQRHSLQLLWGSLAVGGFVLSNSQVLTFGFTDVIPLGDVSRLGALALPYVEVAVGVMVVLLAVTLHRRPNALLLELAELTVLALVFLRNDFYVSFGLFFGGWHALNAIRNALQDVGRFEGFSIRRFIREALPHSVASLGGIALLVWAAQQWQVGIRTELLLFMALSVLAFPHIVVLEQWYWFLRRSRKSAPVRQASA